MNNPLIYRLTFQTPGVAELAQEIDAERTRQLEKWGDQRHPDGTGNGLTLAGYPVAELADTIKKTVDDLASRGFTYWAGIFLEEVFEAMAESEPAKLRAELVQCAAVIAAWISDIDRRPDQEARPATIQELFAAAVRQLPPDDPEQCAETLAAMNERARSEQG